MVDIVYSEEKNRKWSSDGWGRLAETQRQGGTVSWGCAGRVNSWWSWTWGSPSGGLIHSISMEGDMALFLR